MKNRLILSLCFLFFINVVSSHGGGLNSEGCHNNRKTGDYHCQKNKKNL